MKRLVAGTLAVTLLFSNVFCAALKVDKNETVFINLDYYGQAQEINVYNSYIMNGHTEIKDYATYDEIVNLTDNDEPQKGEANIWNVSGRSNFAYIGKMNTANYDKVPWKIDVSYKLNGVPTEPMQLLGKSGLIELDVDIKANETANNFYRNNYILEVTGSFDMDDYLSVESDEAMFVSTGNTKTMMFIVLPGQSTDFALRIGSEKFEMTGLTFAMVPLEGEMFEKVNELVKDKQDIEDAMDAVNESSDIVLYAMKDMSKSFKKVSAGMQVLRGATDKVQGLNGERDSSIENMKSSLNNLQVSINKGKTDLDNLEDSMEDMLDMLEDMQPKLKSMDKSMDSIIKDLEEIRKMVDDLPEDLEDVEDTLYIARKLVENTSSLLRAQNSSGDIEVDELESSLSSIQSETEKIGIEARTKLNGGGLTPEETTTWGKIGASATSIGNELEDVGEVLTEMKSLLNGTTTVSNNMLFNLNALAGQLKEFEKNLDPSDGKTVKDSVEHLKDLTKDLDSMISILSKYNKKAVDSRDNIPKAIKNLKSTLDELKVFDKSFVDSINTMQKLLKIFDSDIYTGTNSTLDGFISMLDEGMNVTGEADQFIYSKNKIKHLVEKQWDKIDDETTIFNINPNEKVVSFSSEMNEEPSKVQFMLKLPDIKETKTDVGDLEAQSDKGNFWTRLLAILKKMFGWIINLFK